MKHDQILIQLTEIFRDVFGNNALVLRQDTISKDLPAWDSMFPTTLAVEIAHRFNVKIRSAEMETLLNVGKPVDLIEVQIVANTIQYLKDHFL